MMTIYLKQLTYNATHRGMKETDVLLGEFSLACLPQLNEQELSLFEQLLAEQDSDILAWCMGNTTVPQTYRSLIGEILAFHKQQR